jgi:parvulin-like peptidyl-prolyl isomerase
LDYGPGNERLLLDYGFVLPLPQSSGDTVALRLEDFVPAISTLDADRAGMSDVSEEDVKELTGLIVSLINLSSQKKAAPLLFDANGRPSLPTRCLALAMTCRGPDDVARLLTPVRAVLELGSNEQLLTQIVESSTEAQTEFAVVALKKAATMALAQKAPLEEPTADDGGGSFADVAREYSDLCRQMLQRVAE